MRFSAAVIKGHKEREGGGVVEVALAFACQCVCVSVCASIFSVFFLMFSSLYDVAPYPCFVFVPPAPQKDHGALAAVVPPIAQR